MSVEEQIAIIFASTKGHMDKVSINRVKEFETDYINQLKAQHEDTLQALSQGKFDDSITDVLKKVASEMAPNYA
jgi:F-type H+-transporting ATPase subunit alpha